MVTLFMEKVSREERAVEHAPARCGSIRAPAKYSHTGGGEVTSRRLDSAPRSASVVASVLRLSGIVASGVVERLGVALRSHRPSEPAPVSS